MEKETQKEDILDSIKKVEKIVKIHILMKSLEELKKKAKRVMELKEESTYLLEEAGVSGKDIKRVIDFINEEIKLTDEEKKELRIKMKSFIKDKKEDTQREIEKNPFIFGGTASSGQYTGNCFTATSGGLYSANSDNPMGNSLNLQSNTGQNLNIAI